MTILDSICIIVCLWIFTKIVSKILKISLNSAIVVLVFVMLAVKYFSK